MGAFEQADHNAGPDKPEKNFLGVENSILGKQWRERPLSPRLAQALAQTFGMPEIIGRVLAGRNVSLETAEAFLSPTLKDALPNPSHFKDMDKAAGRLAKAVMEKETLAIFGDYDVDGATSTALLQRFLIAAGATDVLTHIPDRMTEGYGPNAPALLSLYHKGAAVAVTVDCGITAFEPLETATEQGLDIIVVDHHTAEPRLPKVYAVVNPNRLDEPPGYGHLAAVGVAFLLAVAVNRCLRQEGWYEAQNRLEPNLLKELDLVALGTVCDVVPLTGLNRAYVTQGLKVMAKRQNLGLVALGDVAHLESRPEAYHLGFLLGPRVNAGGRVGESGLGARLLNSDSPQECRALAAQLDSFNQERQDIERTVLEQATEQLKASEEGPGALIFAVGDAWHPGVIGIVAGRLKDHYDRPAFVLALDEAGLAKGSGRSVPGVDLGAAVIAARQEGLLVNGGGHAMAAGLTVERDKIHLLKAFLTERLGQALLETGFTAHVTLDGALKPSGADRALVEYLERVGPFGSGNPKPRFAFPNVQLFDARVVGERHVSCWLGTNQGRRLKAIAFRALDERPHGGPNLGDVMLSGAGKLWHVVGSLKPDDWNGRQDVQLIIDDIADPAFCNAG